VLVWSIYVTISATCDNTVGLFLIHMIFRFRTLYIIRVRSFLNVLHVVLLI